MTRKMKTKIVEEILLPKFLELGYFYRTDLTEGYPFFEFRSDHDELFIDELYPSVIRATITAVGERIEINKEDGYRRGYPFTNLDEFKTNIIRIGEVFFCNYYNEIKIDISERYKLGQLRNLDTEKRLSERLENFLNNYSELSCEEQYRIIFDNYQHHLDDSKGTSTVKMEFDTCFLYGNWIIRSQGGRWKAPYFGNGKNSFVLMHPIDQYKMVDLELLLHKRKIKKELLTKENYEKDCDFWKNIKSLKNKLPKNQTNSDTMNEKKSSNLTAEC
jgi:hypothetical protein